MTISQQEALKREAYRYFNDNIRPIETYIDEHGSMKVVDLYPNDPSINTGKNDDIDAFRHTYAMGKLTMSGVPSSAVKWIGIEHEEDTNNPAGERDMDLWNNAVGIRLVEY